MKVLLTGATGFIGRNLLRALTARGHDVVCAVRNASRRQSNDSRARLIEADFTRDVDPAVWIPRLSGVDVVINAVGILQEQGSQRFDLIHTRVPEALFQACEQAGVRRVIQISALGADNDARSRYHLSKKAADDALARTSLRWVVVQPSLVFGGDGTSARLFTTLATLPLLPVPGRGEQGVQPVHIDDLVATVLALLEPDSPSRTRVVVAGPQPISFAQFIAQLRAAMGLSKLRTVPTPMPLVQLGAAIGSKIPGVMLDKETLDMLNRGNTGDAGLMQGLIGRPPRSVSQFIPPDQVNAIRTAAQLRWLLPLLRISIALVWIVTGIVSLGIYPVSDSYQLLERTGVPASLQPLMLYGAAVVDLLLGVGILLLRNRQWLWLLQLALISTYTLIITVKLPEYWLHPYGPILKNLPMLAAIWMLFELERPVRGTRG